MNNLFFWGIQKINNAFLPLENKNEASAPEKIIAYSSQFLTEALPGILSVLISSPFKLISKIFGKNSAHSPLEDFEKNPQWQTKIDPAIELGVATSEYQINGADNFPYSSWAKWEMSCQADGKTPCIENGDRSGNGLDFWHHPDLLIDKLKELGVKHYRFSVEWSAIQPEKGSIDNEALGKYVYLAKRLKEEGIEPFITLHHFSDPQWFLDDGGFEKEANIQFFVDFSKLIYRELSPIVKEWITFNEPTIYAFQGYIMGVFPPGVKDSSRAAYVLKHMLMAHSEVYDTLKAIDHASKIGIAHQALRFRPYSDNNPLESLVCYYLSQMTHYAVMDFFKTGRFKFQIPFKVNVTYLKPDILEKIDFFGVQYYTDPLIGMQYSAKVMDSTCRPDEKMTDMPLRFYPQGLATVLDECRALGVPVWITETGAATSESDQKEYIKKALKTVSFARANGVNVERVHVWSLIDNFEWNLGWPKKFGLFSFDPVSKESILRRAGQFFQKRIKKSFEGKS